MLFIVSTETYRNAAYLLLFILSFKRVLCNVRRLLCLCRLCLSRHACTLVALSVNLNNKHTDRGDDDGTHIMLKFIKYACKFRDLEKKRIPEQERQTGGGEETGRKNRRKNWKRYGVNAAFFFWGGKLKLIVRA